MAVKTRKGCPLYCTVDHASRPSTHSHLIAEVDVADENALAAVNLIRRDLVDEVELAIGKGFGEPAVAMMTADEARALRDALNVAVALLDRT